MGRRRRRRRRRAMMAAAAVAAAVCVAAAVRMAAYARAGYGVGPASVCRRGALWGALLPDSDSDSGGRVGAGGVGPGPPSPPPAGSGDGPHSGGGVGGGGGGGGGGVGGADASRSRGKARGGDDDGGTVGPVGSTPLGAGRGRGRGPSESRTGGDGTDSPPIGRAGARESQGLGGTSENEEEEEDGAGVRSDDAVAAMGDERDTVLKSGEARAVQSAERGMNPTSDADAKVPGGKGRSLGRSEEAQLLLVQECDGKGDGKSSPSGTQLPSSPQATEAAVNDHSGQGYDVKESEHSPLAKNEKETVLVLSDVVVQREKGGQKAHTISVAEVEVEGNVPMRDTTFISAVEVPDGAETPNEEVNITSGIVKGETAFASFDCERETVTVPEKVGAVRSAEQGADSTSHAETKVTGRKEPALSSIPSVTSEGNASAAHDKKIKDDAIKTGSFATAENETEQSEAGVKILNDRVDLGDIQEGTGTAQHRDERIFRANMEAGRNRSRMTNERVVFSEEMEEMNDTLSSTEGINSTPNAVDATGDDSSWVAPEEAMSSTVKDVSKHVEEALVGSKGVGAEGEKIQQGEKLVASTDDTKRESRDEEVTGASNKIVGAMPEASSGCTATSTYSFRSPNRIKPRGIRREKSIETDNLASSEEGSAGGIQSSNSAAAVLKSSADEFTTRSNGGAEMPVSSSGCSGTSAYTFRSPGRIEARGVSGEKTVETGTHSSSGKDKAGDIQSRSRAAAVKKKRKKLKIFQMLRRFGRFIREILEDEAEVIFA